ncbi:MAG: hypothetical protein KGZ50_02840 [Peptococcaceae bacterium]|nr:hypothetical protein [Peptococcaceae bacterium]
MCNCREILLTPGSEKELRFVRADRPRLVLGNGKPLIFQVVCVTEGSGGREVVLGCECCGLRHVAKINGRYSVELLK